MPAIPPTRPDFLSFSLLLDKTDFIFRPNLPATFPWLLLLKSFFLCLSYISPCSIYLSSFIYLSRSRSLPSAQPCPTISSWSPARNYIGVYTRAPETPLCFMGRVIVWADLGKLLGAFFGGVQYFDTDARKVNISLAKTKFDHVRSIIAKARNRLDDPNDLINRTRRCCVTMMHAVIAFRWRRIAHIWWMQWKLLYEMHTMLRYFHACCFSKWCSGKCIIRHKNTKYRKCRFNSNIKVIKWIYKKQQKLNRSVRMSMNNSQLYNFYLTKIKQIIKRNIIKLQLIHNSIF